MAESNGDNKGIKKDSFNLEIESKITYSPPDLNRHLGVDKISSCNDQESTEPLSVNNDSESRPSDEMPKENTLLDIESVVQKTKDTEKDPSLPVPNPPDQIVEDPMTSEGNCDYHYLFKNTTNYLPLIYRLLYISFSI